MMMLSVYAQNTVSTRSCARSPECHVIRLEERARGPILQHISTIPFFPIYEFQACFHLYQLQMLLSVDRLSSSPVVAMKYFCGE